MGTGLVCVWKLTLDSIIVLRQFCLDGITAELLQWLQYVDSHCWLPAKLSVVPYTDVHWGHVQLLAWQHLQRYGFDYQVTSIYIICTTFFVCQFNYQCQNTHSFFTFNPSPKLNESTCSQDPTTYHIKEQNVLCEVRVLLGALNHIGLLNMAATLKLNTRGGNCRQLEFLHVSYTPA